MSESIEEQKLMSLSCHFIHPALQNLKIIKLITNKSKKLIIFKKQKLENV